MAQRRVAILGSTGSIGTSALDVVAALPEHLAVTALSTHTRVDDLVAQVERFHPRLAVVSGGDVSPGQRARIAAAGATLLTGADALREVARQADVDVVLLAVVGAAGVGVAIDAIEHGKTLALANKETLVVAGCLLMPLARARGVPILPVDSEHSAIFQCLQCGDRDAVRRVLLTASGGPFRSCPIAQMHAAGVADALKHPTWTMGAKVTIDSATMFNKALEIIEAAWLFDLPAEQIDVVVHPQSIVHSMVEYVDGNVIAQLSPPDMRTPIQYALTYPRRLPGPMRRFDAQQPATFEFLPPDLNRFPSLRMGFEVVRTGGTLGAVLNAANEVAVEALRSGKIRLGTIFDVVERTMSAHRVKPSPTLDDLMKADAWARQHARELIDATAP